MTRHTKQHNKQQKPHRNNKKRKTRRHPRAMRKSVGGNQNSVGARLGGRIGSFLGRAAQGALGRVFGMGEYKAALAETVGTAAENIAEGDTPEVNSLAKPLSTNHVTMMHSDEEGTTVVRRREFVGTIEISDAPEVYRYYINPGLPRTFPWLSGLADNWQQWSVCGLAMEYIPTSGLAVSSTSAALGQIVTGFYYEVTDLNNTPEADLPRLLNMNGSVSCSPAATSITYMECNPTMNNQSTYFVDGLASVPGPNFSLQNYLPAVFLVNTSGAQSATAFQAGQLWVSYEIVLKQPLPAPRQVPIGIPEHPRFAKYLAVYRKWCELTQCTGPMTGDQWTVLMCEVDRLRAILNSAECQNELRIIRAAIKHAESEADTAHHARRIVNYLNQTTYSKEIQNEVQKAEDSITRAEAAEDREDGVLLPSLPSYR